MTNFDFVQKYEIRIFHFIDTLTQNEKKFLNKIFTEQLS